MGNIIFNSRMLMVIVLFNLVAACSVTDRRETATTTRPSSSTDERRGNGAPHQLDSYKRVVSALLEKADRQIGLGDLQGALSTLERALRIAPQRALIYLRLAQVYHHFGDASLASNMARRGLLYCRDIDCASLKTFIN